MLDKPAMSSLIFDVSTAVRANAIDIHAPVTTPEQPTIVTPIAVAFSGEVFPYALIIIACVILVLGVAGIIYICISWSRSALLIILKINKANAENIIKI